MPFNNSSSCSSVQSWISTNKLTMYTGLDSGKQQVAHYGGFGMPTVVLVGGRDHKVLFSTLGFSTSDTIVMRDSMDAFFRSPTAELRNFRRGYHFLIYIRIRYRIL